MPREKAGVSQRTISKASKSKSARAKLWLPVSRVERALRQGNYARRISAEAAVYLTAVIEYLCSEIFELAGHAAQDYGKFRISPRHLMLAIRKDEELNIFMRDTIIMRSGVIPQIQSALLPPRKIRNAPETEAADTSSQEY